MKHASLFSGIGGFDLAAEWMGWENVFHCEWMPFPRQVLKHHFPNSISYEDITKTDFSIHRGTIDVLTGGFPCQPYSVAGKRLGKEDGRHLWPEMLRAIQEIEPRFVVGENVRGLVNWNGGLVFDEVQTDLENEGYEVIPFIIPACAVGAPHRRDRVWFVAYYNNKGGSNGHRQVSEKDGEISERNESTEPCDTNTRDASNAKSTGGIRLSERKEQEVTFNGSVGSNGNASNSFSVGQPGEKHRKEESGLCRKNSQRPNWNNFPTQSPICGGDDGLPTELDREAVFNLLEGGTPRGPFILFAKWRNESIKGYGNAIVPQVAYEIFKAIQQSSQ